MPRGHKDSRNPELNVTSIGNYTLIKTLGEGNFAKVKLAKHKITGAEVAIKIIDKTKMDPKKIDKMYREVRILKMLHHPNIIKLYEVIETTQTVFLVMEYVSSGELYDYLVVHGKMKEKEARAKFRQILSAVSYCHKKRVIHRDLKAENVLLDANNNIKVADFGFSNNYDPYDKLDTFCGSPPYAAPELFQGRRYTGPEVDVWSLGVILYVMTTGCLPFSGKNLQEVRESVCRGKYRVPFYISDSCEKLIKKFLERDPSKRASLDLFRNDPWLNEGFDDSPIDVQIDEAIEQDDEIIDKIVEKYNVDRNKLIKNLNNTVYDDISAIYYLMYYNKKTREEKGYPKSSLMDDNVVIKNEDGSKSTYASPNIEPSVPNKKNEDDENDTFPTTTTVNPGTLKPITPLSAKQPTRARRFTIDSAYNPMSIKNDLINKKNSINNNNNNNNESSTTAEKVTTTPTITNSSNDNTSNNDGVKKPSEISRIPSPVNTGIAPRRLVPIPPSDKPPSSTLNPPTVLRRVRHNTISEAVPPTIIKPPADTVNQTLQEDSENNDDDDTNNDPTKPRTVRVTMNTNTTSSKAPDEIIRSIIMACKNLGINHKMIGRYLIECSASENETVQLLEKTSFEVEVCKLPDRKSVV